jgi:excisionase family DNA binding protein
MNPPPTLERILFSRAEAARALSMSISTLDILIARGTIRTRRHGRRVLVAKTEIERVARTDALGPIWPAN